MWPNGWTDQDETWHAGRPRPWPHCARWGSSSPPQKRGHSPQFSAHVCCAQTAGWIKMPLGMEVDLGPGHIVLDGDPAPLPRKGAQPPIFGSCLLWPNGWMNQGATWYDGRPRPWQHCVRCGPISTLQGAQPSPKFWPIQPFGHNRHGPKFGGCDTWVVELGPHVTQCCPGRGLPPYQVAS